MSKFDLKYLDNLADLMISNGLTEMHLIDSEQTIIYKREKEIVAATYTAPGMMPRQAIASQLPNVVVEETAPDATPAKTGKAVKSPMVGTFYRASSPDAPPFVEVGGLVAQGEVVCIIEAMKLMNEIESDFSGKIVEICVENGQPVEYGQVLMYIE
jgi:acetyl-CoA carboxylase biotin carboxyl carrier protein